MCFILGAKSSYHRPNYETSLIFETLKTMKTILYNLRLFLSSSDVPFLSLLTEKAWEKIISTLTPGVH